jgi:hypothetical protein
MRVYDQNVANPSIYMAPFWRENQLVLAPTKTKKKTQRRDHDLENQDAI